MVDGPLVMEKATALGLREVDGGCGGKVAREISAPCFPKRALQKLLHAKCNFPVSGQILTLYLENLVSVF